VSARHQLTNQGGKISQSSEDGRKGSFLFQKVSVFYFMTASTAQADDLYTFLKFFLIFESPRDYLPRVKQIMNKKPTWL